MILNLRAEACSWTGYGQAAEAIGRDLERRGWLVAYEPIGIYDDFGPPSEWVRERLIRRGEPTGPTLQITPCGWPVPKRRPVVLCTMYEATRPSPQAAAEMNRALRVLVPSTFNAVSFSAAGCDQPIDVVPMGHNPAVYRKRDSGPDVIRFGVAGRIHHGGARKGIWEAIEAFEAVEGDAELWVKVWPDDPLPTVGDPRVTIFREPLDAAGMAGFYRGLTALLVPSKGEGFGLQTLEAMACGVPVIAAPWSGTADLVDESRAYLLPYTLEPARGCYLERGEWAVPSVAGMTAAMRRVIHRPLEAEAKGEMAAAFAKRLTWERCGERMDAVLREVFGCP